ncbi:MAG: ABC transporter substrate-binding protein/permease, partial [Phycisphaerae bacterium]
MSNRTAPCAGAFQRAGAVLVAFAALIALVAPAGTARAQEQEDRETLRVALTGKYPPFSFYDRDGKLAGFDVDVSREVARHTGRELQIVPTEWDGILVGLRAEKFDAIIGSMAINEKRQEQVDFSQPYYYSGAQLFIHERDKDELGSIEDMKGRKVGVVSGETFEQFLRQEYPDVEVVPHTSAVEIFENLRQGRIDGFLSDLLVGTRQIEEAGEPFTLVGPLLYRERMAIPVRKEDDRLLQEINEALTEIKQSGRLEEIAVKWLGPAGKQAVLEPEGSAAGQYEGGKMTAGTVARMLLKAFGLTLFIGVSSLLIGFLLAVPAGAVLNHPLKPDFLGSIHFLVRCIVDFIRGTPVIVQLFFVYFGLPYVGITLDPIPAAVLTLSINAMAYMAEVVRSGLMSVDRGQKLAGRALGFTKLQTFRLVVWPQAFRIALPPLMNSVVALIKDT